MERALNMLSTGIVFLGYKGEVLLVNTEAEEVFKRTDGLLLKLG
jgi:nitrogen fixation/metabolism regulation signal transduction histidine kinase